MLAFIPVAAALAAQPALGPTPEPTQGEIDALEACIAGAGPAQAITQCRGQVASACLDQPGGETTMVQLACTRRELSIWSAQLDQAESAMVQALEQAYTPSRPDAFEAAQHAWRAFMQAECRQQSLLFEGGRFERVLVADCVMRLTAERAISLQVQRLELEA